MSRFASRCWAFVKSEVVLCAAILLALISACFVPPSPAYISYIDWDTLALLFSLMAVMKGFQQEGLFEFLGSALLRRTGSTRAMLAVLVFLPFFCSMVITNDVSLITFVPFAIAVLHLAHQESRVIYLVVLQTLAANLGSMFTPMGNPQNLYLYARSGMTFWELCGVMLPYVVALRRLFGRNGFAAQGSAHSLLGCGGSAGQPGPSGLVRRWISPVPAGNLQPGAGSGHCRNRTGVPADF